MQSCETDHTGGGCPKYSTNYQTLSASSISQTSYFSNKAFDTISFASNKGDTLTFVKTKTDTTWYCEDDNSNPNCPKEKAICYQTIHNAYTTIKGNGSFDVMHSKKKYTEAFDYAVPNVIVIKFTTFYFVFFEDIINDNSYNKFLGNTTIKNKTYMNTFYEYHNFSDSTIGKGVFCPRVGIINIKENLTNTNWDLIN